MKVLQVHGLCHFLVRYLGNSNFLKTFHKLDKRNGITESKSAHLFLRRSFPLPPPVGQVCPVASVLRSSGGSSWCTNCAKLVIVSSCRRKVLAQKSTLGEASSVVVHRLMSRARRSTSRSRVSASLARSGQSIASALTENLREQYFGSL